MPTDTDVKLVEDLADFRVEVEKRFGLIEKSLEGIAKQLGFIRWAGTFFAGVLVVLVGASISIAWYASGVVSDVRYQGQRIDKLEGRLDAMDKKLDLIISRTAPAPKVGG